MGAKVMLTYYTYTSDGLTNGASGKLVGITEDERGSISKLRKNPGISKKYPGGTPIEKLNISFSISK